jgi:hypothetical protein
VTSGLFVFFLFSGLLARWGCRTLCPDTGAAAPALSGPAARPTIDSIVSFSSLVSCTFAPATTTPSGPPPASTIRLRAVPFLPRSEGSGLMRSPKTRLAHRAVGALPLPVDAPQFLAVLDQQGPDPLENAPGNPALHGAMKGRVDKCAAVVKRRTPNFRDSCLFSIFPAVCLK